VVIVDGDQRRQVERRKEWARGGETSVFEGVNGQVSGAAARLNTVWLGGRTFSLQELARSPR
jgi:hypothetical protein